MEPLKRNRIVGVSLFFVTGLAIAWCSQTARDQTVTEVVAAPPLPKASPPVASEPKTVPQPEPKPKPRRKSQKDFEEELAVLSADVHGLMATEGGCGEYKRVKKLYEVFVPLWRSLSDREEASALAKEFDPCVERAFKAAFKAAPKERKRMRESWIENMVKKPLEDKGPMVQTSFKGSTLTVNFHYPGQFALQASAGIPGVPDGMHIQRWDSIMNPEYEKERNEAFAVLDDALRRPGVPGSMGVARVVVTDSARTRTSTYNFHRWPRKPFTQFFLLGGASVPLADALERDAYAD